MHPDDAHALKIQLATALRERDEALRKLRVMCDAHSDLSARGLLDDKLLSECERTFRTLPLNYQPDELLAQFDARAALAGGGDRG